MPAGITVPTDGGAGFNLKSPAWLPKDFSLENGMPKGVPEQMQRALAVAAYFFSGVVAINTTQMLAAPMSVVNKDWYEGWLSLTKQSFGLLTTTMTQFWAPTVMRVSGDASVRGQLMKTDDGDLICNFPDRLVLIANHQIYTDWLYLWWVAYTAGKHGNVYIILKESLKKIPVIGWGMQLNKFIFLKRNWEKDKPHLSAHMQRLNKLAEPMWLMLFPEGTNLAPDTRIKSGKWATKNHLKDMQHTLLPRSTGLRFCLQELRSSVGWVYDCTIAYSGVPRGQYAQDIYTLRASYLEGRPPKSVNMYWRRFRVSDIPLDNPLAFESWLLARWREKDNLIEYFYKYGKFPADRGISMGPRGEFLRGAGHIESEVRANKWRDFLQVFAPMGMLALVLFMFYGALPKEMIDAIGGQAGELGKNAEVANGGKKLLAFDGSGFKQISQGPDDFAKVVREGLARRPVRRAESVSSMSTGPMGPTSTVQSSKASLRSPTSTVQNTSRAPSATQSEPKKLLGFSDGHFKETSPARSVATTRTAATRNTAPAVTAKKQTVALPRRDERKLLGFADSKHREVSTVAKPSSPSKSSSQSAPPKKHVASTQSSKPPAKSSDPASLKSERLLKQSAKPNGISAKPGVVNSGDISNSIKPSPAASVRVSQTARDKPAPEPLRTSQSQAQIPASSKAAVSGSNKKLPKRNTARSAPMKIRDSGCGQKCNLPRDVNGSSRTASKQ